MINFAVAFAKGVSLSYVYRTDFRTAISSAASVIIVKDADCVISKMRMSGLAIMLNNAWWR